MKLRLNYSLFVDFSVFSVLLLLVCSLSVCQSLSIFCLYLQHKTDKWPFCHIMSFARVGEC